MAANEGGKKKESNSDLYGVLGLRKECSETELKNAYRKLAMKWHPDRCSASGNERKVEESKKKFQDIQQAYSVLSDANKRFMYDVGVYDSDDDENGMGDFLNEMATMMSQTKPNENEKESLEDLKEIFDDMFQGPIGTFSSSASSFSATNTCSTSTTCAFYSENSNNNKRHSSQMNYGATNNSDLSARFGTFCFGQSSSKARGLGGGGDPGRASGRRRQGRKQKVSSAQDISCND